MNRRLERVNIASLRVALAATAAFAVVYAIVAALIVLLVTNNLQSQLDSRLMQNLAQLQSAPECARMFAATRAAAINNMRVPFEWINDNGGNNVCTNTQNPALPQAAMSVGTPTSLTIYNVQVRLVSAPVDGGRVVVAESLDTVTQTRDTIAFTEFIVGLVLLAVAFVGALYGGRRVGAPIEIARQRQMEFTADASHELRTPLSVIEAQTSLALAHDRDAAWYRNAFTRIGHESKRIRGLVEDLLWLARADSSPKEEHSDPVEVGVLAAQTADRFSAVAEARGVTLGVTIGRGSHMVVGSAEWLDRLLGVLIDNACKYAPDGGRVRVSVVNDGNRVRAVVEDSGPGIPPDERTRIFERFHRGTSDKPGAGLGLAIADAVVRRTHGRWEVGTSRALGGASVGVSWSRVGSGSREPLHEDASPDPSAPPQAAAPAQPAPPSPPAGAPAPSPPSA